MKLVNTLHINLEYCSCSPCSGLVVSGYSRQKTVELFNTHLTQAMNPYEKFKKMYIVDRTTEEFKGLNWESHIFFTLICLLNKNLILKWS